jgi:hypothetical protein
MAKVSMTVSEEPVEIPEADCIRFLMYRIDALTQMVYYNRLLIAGMDDPKEMEKMCAQVNREILLACAGLAAGKEVPA